MGVTATVKIDIDVGAPLAKLGDDALWTFAAKRWHAIYTPFVPVDTGRLATQVIYAPGSVSHTAPYAAYQYRASGGWDALAAPSGAGELAREIQQYIDGGGLGFGS